MDYLPVKKTEKITQLRPQTMDELWKEAESLGRVSVESKYDETYEAEIYFTRKSGTSIRAKGKNTDAVFALADAINEAREMGAGTQDT